MKKYDWNPVFNLVLKIKNDYIQTFGALDTMLFEEWLTRLQKKEYIDIFSHLKVRQKNNLILIRYGMDEMHESMWTDQDSVYRECRSVVINIEKEELVVVPFRKFFNINEVEENSLSNIIDKINNAKSVEITDKLDGSMQSVRYYNDEIFISGSMAIDIESSWRLEDGFSKLTDGHRRMICDHPEYTFIFEYISIRDSHVVAYTKDQEGMYLIGIRNVYTGEQLSYKDVSEYANKYNILMTRIEKRSFEEILQDITKYRSSEKEGWVVNIDGHMVKIKCDDYVQLHRVLNKFSSINTVIKAIADNTYDDLLSKLPDNYRDRINTIAAIIFDYIRKTNEKIEEYYENAPKEDKKEYMVWVTDNCPVDIRGYLRQKYLNVDYNILKTSYVRSTRYKKANEMGIDQILYEQASFDFDK